MEDEEVALLMDLFEAPYRVSINMPSIANGSRNGMLVGLILEGRTMLGIVMLEDGELTQINTSYFRIDWRYDVESDLWRDLSAPNPDQT